MRQMTAQDTAVYIALYGDLTEKELNRLARELGTRRRACPMARRL